MGSASKWIRRIVGSASVLAGPWVVWNLPSFLEDQATNASGWRRVFAVVAIAMGGDVYAWLIAAALMAGGFAVLTSERWMPARHGPQTASAPADAPEVRSRFSDDVDPIALLEAKGLLEFFRESALDLLDGVSVKQISLLDHSTTHLFDPETAQKFRQLVLYGFCEMEQRALDPVMDSWTMEVRCRLTKLGRRVAARL